MFLLVRSWYVKRLRDLLRVFSPLLWLLRRNEEDVVGLYQFFTPYVEYATGTKMLNFGYWIEGSTENIEKAQDDLCTLTGTIAELDSAEMVIDVGSGFSAPAAKWELKYNLINKIICIDINYKELMTATKNIEETYSHRSKNLQMSSRSYDRHGYGYGNEATISVVNATATNLPLGDHFADRVIALESAQHFKPLNDFIRESSRILKHGGLLVMAIPVVRTETEDCSENIHISALRIIRQLGILSITWASEHYQLEYIKSVISNENFKIKQIEYIGSAVYGPLADYYIRNRIVINQMFRHKRRHYLQQVIYKISEKIVYRSALKMKELSQKGTIDYVLIKASRSDNKISEWN